MMDNNIFITQLSSFANCSAEEASQCINSLVEWMTDSIISDGQLTISGFGKFHVEKQMEYIQVDSSSGKKHLIPPSLSLSFKAAPLLKDKDKTNIVAFSTMAKVLTEKNKLLPLQAEKMAVGFFKYILIQMEEGKPVNIDGLGEFVLTKVEVDDKVYGKITFLADKILAEKINRPFSYFFPVELNEGINFDDIETKGPDSFVQSSSNAETFLISDSSQSESSQEPIYQEEGDIIENNDTNTNGSVEIDEPVDDDVNDGQIDKSSELALKTEREGMEENIEPETPNYLTSENGSSLNGNLKLLAIAAGICALCIIGILLLRNSGEAQPSVTAATDTTVTQVVEEVKTDTVPMQQENLATTGKADNMPVDNYSELNAKIPYGAYDIVGVQAEISAPAGMDMATIARVYMGSDNPIYLEVMNGGETNPEPGKRIIIPKLRERKIRK